MRKHAGSMAHSVGGLPCQYPPSHELGPIPQMPQVPQMPGSIPQVPTSLHQNSSVLHQVSCGVPQVPNPTSQITTAMSQVPTTMSSHVTIPGHLTSLTNHPNGMQVNQLSGIQPPTAHSAPTSLSHNSGNYLSGFT